MILTKTASGKVTEKEITFGYQNPLILTAFSLSGFLAIIGSILLVLLTRASYRYLATKYHDYIEDQRIFEV